MTADVKLNKKKILELLSQNKLKELFTQHLGWNNFNQTMPIQVEGKTYTLNGIVNKEGFAIFEYTNNETEPLKAVTRKKISNQLSKTYYEHLLIFNEKNAQLWQRVNKASKDKPMSTKTETYNPHYHSGERLYQKLTALSFGWDDYTITDVVQRFNDTTKDKVTKKFYEEFKKNKDNFSKFIEGIQENIDKEWYSSLMLNRLMFPTRRSSDLELEKKYKDISIPDYVFEKIFDFFDKYDWHLDDRPVSDDKQINPDVIGHIFEKYINQKQMGAYYTKEDITEYIGKNTILPYLFEEAKKKCEIAFKTDGYIWQMLKDNPDKYIYEAVKKGCEKELPENIKKGINNVSQRENWNTPALEEYALPTEIWRETVERRNRYFEIKSKLKNGEITSINDFITYNLDIRQFIEDIINKSESSDVIKAFYYTIAGHIGEKSNGKDIPAMSILDPTCGSGAFLFAALNILEPIYSSCIERMEDFKAEKPDSYKEFDSILDNIEEHPNKEYFIYKSIILNNLYGVDIMKEAAEIAKLRLFLKLASCAEVDYKKENFGLEALPDIDFNIRAGNSLVGFANYSEVKDAVEHNTLSGQMNLLSGNVMDVINEKAQMVSLAYRRFRECQDKNTPHEVLIASKRDLQDRLTVLNNELNRYMAKKYGIDVENQPKDYEKWLLTHEPFNWFVEFYDVIHNRGGFDVIIGNPPYVEYNKKDKITKKAVSDIYKIKDYQTEECGNLYAFVIEIACKILNNNANFGMIVPVSLGSTPRMETLRIVLNNTNSSIFYSNYADRPSCLFSGVHQILSIFIIHKDNSRKLYSSGFKHWTKNERENIFKNMFYVDSTNCIQDNLWGKFGNKIAINIYSKIKRDRQNLMSYFRNIGRLVTVSGGTGGYWLRSFDNAQSSNKYKNKYVENEQMQKCICAFFNSTIFYFIWRMFSNCRDFTDASIEKIFIDFDNKDFISSLTINSEKHLIALKATNEIREGEMTYEQYRPSKVKAELDEIDKILAKHYGFTDEELDYIINYDIKYRMGDALNGDDNDAE